MRTSSHLRLQRDDLYLRITRSPFALALLADPRNWKRSRLLAWVLMPDHWHGLFVLGEEDMLPRRVGWLKAESAWQLRAEFPQVKRVWARAYHDRGVRREEDLRALARYVVLNPVRAGLVRRVGDYPFWDATWLGTANALVGAACSRELLSCPAV